MKINNQKKHYADKLVTPKYLFNLSQKKWKVKCNIDVAADRNNKKCRRYISKEKDYLKQFKFKRTDVLWGNFPHSKQKEFVIHTVKVCKLNRCRALLLLPINVLTSAYAVKYLLPVIKFEKKMIIKGRHKFLTPRSLKVSSEPSVNGYVAAYIPKRIKK
jgi:phage N-6-adenine-methyltransferase